MDNIHMDEITLSKLILPNVIECNYLVCHEAFYHPDRRLPFHVLIYVVSGQIAVIEDETEYVLNAGNMLFLKKGLHHYGKKLIETGTAWYYVHFDLPDEYEYSIETRLLPKFTQLVQNSQVEQELKEFIHSYNHPTPVSKWKDNAGLYNVLSDLFFLSSKVASPRRDLADKIEQFLKQNCRVNFDSGMLEKEFNRSAKYLESVFKAEKEQSMQRFHTEARMREACFLLQTSFYTIGEISTRLGYKDMFYFSRTFRKIYGLSPSDYRKKIIRRY